MIIYHKTSVFSLKATFSGAVKVTAILIQGNKVTGYYVTKFNVYYEGIRYAASSAVLDSSGGPRVFNNYICATCI